YRSMPMSYLFLVSIGPVQEFISTARRTRDLAYGSWLLSELSKAAALAIVNAEDPGPEGLNSLIFPAPTSRALLEPNNTELRSIGNKIVAQVQHSPGTLGPIVQAAVEKRLEE